jgi:hypothetical protein
MPYDGPPYICAYFRNFSVHIIRALVISNFEFSTFCQRFINKFYKLFSLSFYLVSNFFLFEKVRNMVFQIAIFILFIWIWEKLIINAL